ncbi:hypothetical protein C0J52_08095 [Blattella germanica]|nr:hypothetical protein C0J52_08095 [Blattella germanica]
MLIMHIIDIYFPQTIKCNIEPGTPTEMTIWTPLVALTVLVAWNANPTSCANILALLPTPSPSHHIWTRALSLGLAARGHKVVVLTPDPEKEPVPNQTEIIIEDVYERIHEAEFNYEQMSTLSYAENSAGWFIWGQDACEHSMGTKAIQKLLELKGKVTFDLIIIDMTLEECFLAFVPLFNNPPIIAITAYVSPPWYNVIVGNPQMLSYTSTYVLPYSDHMTFTQRAANFFLHNYVLFYHQFYHMPTMDKIVRKRFGEAIPVPSEIIKNISLVMVNTHFSFDYPRPSVPALIEVGGMQVKPGKELPKHGAIFFSLGTNIRSDKLSQEKLKAFLGAFAELPQRVLWKFESDVLPNQPKNVMVRKWLPQNDILAHPNLRLFLSHAGMLSSQEAVYHGVPVVGIPFMADQFYNIFKLQTRGLGELLIYEENMKKMSILYRDQPETPLERAIFWTEYVIRHKGAPHLRARSADMPLYEYLLLDVIGALVAAVMFVFALFCLILWRMYRFIAPAQKGAMKFGISILPILTLLFGWEINQIFGAKILALLPVASPSHHIMNRALYIALITRGHQLTVITPDAEKQKLPNLTEYLIEGVYEKIHESEFDYADMSSLNHLENSITWFEWGEMVCGHSLDSKAVDKLLELKDKERFDLVIIDMTFQECFLALVPLFNSPPVIAITAYISPPWFNMIVGNPQILSYTSTYVLPYSDHMTFLQRMENFLIHNYVMFYYNFVYLPAMDSIVRARFGDSIAVPSETIKNISMVMVNTHISIDYPRPIVPAMVEIGGLQTRPGQELPKDLKKFLDEAEHGAIFFSLGTNIMSNKLKEEKVKAFLEAFAELPQRVLWKWESDVLPNQPKNGFEESAAMRTLLTAIFLLIFGWKTNPILSAKILAIMPVASPSHHIYDRSLTVALAERGHQITIITPDAEKKPVPNLTEIIIEGLYEKIHESDYDYEEMSTMSILDNSVAWYEWGQFTCNHSINTKAVDTLLALKDKETFDLILMDLTLQECFLGLVPLFNSPPVIAITAYASPPWYNEIVGNPQFPAYISTYILPFSDQMSFFERMANFLLHNYVMYHYYYSHLPGNDDIVRKRFGDSISPPSEVVKKISLVMVNTHLSMDYPRPTVPALLEVRGMQVKPGKELPKLFISHSGMLSTQEAVYHGVPVVGMPFLADQYYNIFKLKTHGLGEHLSYLTLSKESILRALHKVLDNPRHKGAPHLRVRSADMPLYQYLLLDVIGALIAAVVLVLYLSYRILAKIFSFIPFKKNKKSKQQ